MLNATEAFNAGFLLFCAERGLNSADTNELISKTAFLDSLANIPSAAAKGYLTSALATGVVGGGALGAAAATMGQDMDDPLKMKQPEVLNRIQKAELAATYRQNAEALKQHLMSLKARRTKPVRSPYGI